NNSLSNNFNIFSNTSYNYLFGKYDYNGSEFRGFNIVNETLSDNSAIVHYFHQSDALKGKEFLTITYDSNNNIFSKTENNYNVTKTNSESVSIVQLILASSYLYDGSTESPKITNISYTYDNYSNVISKTSFGDISISGDEKYERYEFVYNSTAWILDKVKKYTLLASDNSTKLRETKYFYDNKLVGLTKGDLTKQEEWLDDETGNPVTYYNYDEFGNPYRQTDPLGRTIIYYYGNKDNTNTYPDRRVNELGHAVDYEYDVSTGNILSTTRNGITFSNEYDTFGRISKEIQPYDSSNLPTKSYTYDFDGIAPEIIKVSQKTTSNNTIGIYYYYDGFANLVQIKTPAENGQQIVKNIFYDGLFRVKEEQNPYFSTSTTTLTNVSNTTNTTKYNYDSLSRITKVTNPDGTLKQTIYNKSTIKDFDENNNFKTYYLDAYYRIIAVEEHNTDFYIGDNLTYNTTYSYNGADELVGIRDNEGNNFNFTYNSLGQKIQLDDPDLGTWKYEYDFAGNLIKQTDNKGNQILMGYDGLNRILNKNYTEEDIIFSYDKQYQGTLHNATFPNVTYEYEYDDRLRVIKEIAYLENQSFITGNTYDSADRVIQKLLSDDTELDSYYNTMGKLDRINNFINKTNYNAFGIPLNRTYFNSRITTFDYDKENARLMQIKTDNIQQLNYTYDNVGNIIGINDSINNRTYSMSYDRLDRLTNVTINDFSWVYHYDSIGRILKVVRNFTETTSLKYGEGPVHAPHKVIKTDTGVDVYRQSNFNGSNKTKVFEFYLVNEKNDSLTNVNWTARFGDGSIINSTQLLNLSVKDNVLVIVEHNYTKGSDYRINFTGRSSANANDYEILKLLFGAIANDLSIIKKNGTLIVTQFSAENTINELSQNWGWNCSNGVFSTVPFNMSGNQGLLVVMEHNYSLSSLSHNLTCIVNSTDGNQSLTLPFNFNGIAVEGYNSSLKGESGIEVQFQIVNYFNTLNVEWNITAAGQTAQSTAPITLTQGESTSITQEFNFTTRGVKPLKITIYSGNFTDTYSENIRLYSLDILDFLNIVKNGTTRIFNFIIQNDWINLTAYWNVSNPVIENTTILDTNESLIVIIEENYGQGKKEVEVKLYNQSVLEDSITEVFTIKEIGIDEFENLHQNDSWAVTSALVTNNINPLNISWMLDNSQQNISSTQSLELDTSGQAFIIVESNFSESGIYPLNFLINSSNKNDNVTGVAIS
ncbi:MAG: RHS repeat protein, partial [Candidatus Aenigmarchaeota archaeon]|nr:RHS repeat protein [Candidatus Aenigmarchaeota archaeon]